MIRDREGARFQYRRANALLPDLKIDEASGRFQPPEATTPAEPPATELVCFVAIGRAPAGLHAGHHGGHGTPFADIYVNGKLAGRSHPFVSTRELLVASEQKLAALRLAKTAARIAIKETVIHAVAEEDDLLAALLRVLLYAFERPDNRRWETLPRWLQVARVRCPSDLAEFRVVFRTAGGQAVREKIVRAPLSKRGRVFISFCRDL
jgi:hypothetical protein